LLSASEPTRHRLRSDAGNLGDLEAASVVNVTINVEGGSTKAYGLAKSIQEQIEQSMKRRCFYGYNDTALCNFYL